MLPQRAMPSRSHPAPNELDSDASKHSHTTTKRIQSLAPSPIIIFLLLLGTISSYPVRAFRQSRARQEQYPPALPDGRPSMRRASSALILRSRQKGSESYSAGRRKPISCCTATQTRRHLTCLIPDNRRAAYRSNPCHRSFVTTRPSLLACSAIPEPSTPSAATTATPPAPSSQLPPGFPPLPDMNDPNHTKYEKLVRRLYMTNLFHPVKLGLDNIERLHEALGSPMDNSEITIIHIAGTNGKGSVALKIAKSLEAAGNTVGLFNSPHVSSFRERMQVNGALISESDVEDRLPRIFAACEQNHIPATFFEVTTALAFLHFAESGVNAVVLETGLGGRLDATNVVRTPAITVITSIGLEHTRILGETVEEIALEKGGIIKEGRPVLVGPNVPHDVLRRCAEEKGADGYYTCDDVLGGVVLGHDDAVVTDGNGGEEECVDYDKENSRIATAALELVQRQDRPNLLPVTEEQIRKGTAVRPPCRFEQVNLAPPGNDDTDDANKSVSVVLDVAHNPDAMIQLVSKLERTYPDKKKRIVCGFSSDKDLALCGAALLSTVPDASSVHLVEAAHPRAAKLEEMLEAEPRLRRSNFDEVDRSIAAQVRSAARLASDREEVLVVCGSVFLMAEAREALGYDEPRDSDYIAEVAGANLKHGQENFGDSDPEKVVVDNADASGGGAGLGGG